MVFYLACGDYWRSRHFILWFACSFWSYQQDSDSQKEKDERCLTSRRSQPPLARSVPLSRFTSRVGGGSAFFVRRPSITMSDYAKTALEILKLAPRYLVSLGIIAALFLFSPDKSLKWFGVDEFAKHYRVWLSIVFISTT